jgi:hypothetical protein
MKLTSWILVLVSLGFSTTNLWADTLNLNLSNTDSVAVNGVGSPTSVDGEVFTYDALGVNVIQNGQLAGIYNLNFTGTLLDVGNFPAGIASEFLVTESCINIAIGARGPQCSGLSFTYDNTSLGPLDLQALVGVGVNIGADINGVDIAGIDTGVGLDAGIGGGSETLGFGNPPPSASPTPEPGTLSLLGTGLLGVAGVVRKRFA